MTPEARLRQRVRFPVLALTAGAWIALLLVGVPHAQAQHEAAVAVPILGGASSASHLHALAGSLGHPGALGPVVVGSALMLVAMMAPLLIPALRHVIDRSLPAARRRAAALLSLGYAGTWSLAWIVLLIGAALLQRVTGPKLAWLVAVVVVIVWQASPAKQRSLNRCHARPALAAFGRPADADALRFGYRHAQSCIGSCWALMLLPLLAPAHSLVTMVVVALWMWAERLENPAPPAWRLRVPTAWSRIVLGQASARARRSAGLRSRA